MLLFEQGMVLFKYASQDVYDEKIYSKTMPEEMNYGMTSYKIHKISLQYSYLDKF